ncbi:hypothetical protein [Paenibacillus sp. GP183]|uniref:hypothetical protein n=1 Tax=Paenibacillus sp. GP183 TaxID=1882751 RepID=UPI00111511FA|nr:hypothetical protein [Paenibacillus sp. GP183]
MRGWRSIRSAGRCRSRRPFTGTAEPADAEDGRMFALHVAPSSDAERPRQAFPLDRVYSMLAI